ncbi:IS4 family transposase [Olivibacter sp. SDN3]|uniref:IS4 family transposase n=1 Tax=Olivibacter sp. SDN3 TaxID=2764720 RepID=UPI0016510001|nr:IS4 family transposase [Olivibacter sp. SDN3]QNL50281.1 IS4 family transposase [Olivibacter sp. SDN3]
MNKSNYFSGQPLVSQLIKYLDREEINRTAKKEGSDRYYKKFHTYDHLVTMLMTVISGCSSLREISGLFLACQGRIGHLGLKDFPRRSTFAEANSKRSSDVFAKIYQKLYRRYRSFLPDSRKSNLPLKDLYIVDSTTISLFSDVLKGAGRNPREGKKKGGIKVHTMIHSREDVPSLVRFSSAATHDHVFLKELELKRGSFVVFDKGYIDYAQYASWDMEGVFFVTRQKENAVYESLEQFAVLQRDAERVMEDEVISIDVKGSPLLLRRVFYYDHANDSIYEFLSNNFELEATAIADIYRQREIESLFKRLKQNFPLKYFLGESQNAIEIQIWVSLIAQLILLVIKERTKRRWAFSNMVSFIRSHALTYINLFKFLDNPNVNWNKLTSGDQNQLNIFQT